QIGEPLSEACRRVAESEVWNACCEKFPHHCKDFRSENSFEPYDRPSVSLYGDPLRHFFLSTLAGADEKDKLNRVFKSAPPWLIWFTFADYTVKLLDLNLPDLSSVRGFERSKDIFYGERSKGIFYGWWALPESAFECRPWPNGADRQPLARTDLNLLRSGTAQDTPITNRERKRALANSARSSLSRQIDWPYLSSEERLQVDPHTSLAQLREAGY